MGFLSKLFTLFKNDSSDRRAQIEEHEARIRAINDKLSDMIKQINELETQLRALFVHYDTASGASKETYKVQILSLKKRIDGLKETRDLHARNLEKEQLLIQKLEFVQEASNTNIDSDEIEDLKDDVTDVNLDLQVEDQALNELEKSKYIQKKTPAKQPNRTDQTIKSEKESQTSSVSSINADSSLDDDEIVLQQLRAELNQEEV